MKPFSVLPADYPAFLADLKACIQSARISAARAVNRDLILLYWDIGQAIMKKQQQRGWGDAVVESLSRDLRAEFLWVTGFSIQNLWRIRKFYMDMFPRIFFHK